MKRKAEPPKPTPDELHSHVKYMNEIREFALDYVYFPVFADTLAAESELIIGKSALLEHVRQAVDHFKENPCPFMRQVLILRPLMTTEPVETDYTKRVRCWLYPLPEVSRENPFNPDTMIKHNTMLSELCMVTASHNEIYNSDTTSRRARPRSLPSTLFLSALNFNIDDSRTAKTEDLLMNIMALLRAFASSTPKQNFKLPSLREGWFVEPRLEKLVYVLMAHMFSDDPNWRPVIIKGWASLMRRCIEADPLFIFDMSRDLSRNMSGEKGIMTPGQFKIWTMSEMELMLRTSSDVRVGGEMMISQDTSDIREIIKEMVSSEKGLGPLLACFLGN